MKKSVKKLKLALKRETIAELDLGKVAAGQGSMVNGCSAGCSGASCAGQCHVEY